MSAQLNIAPPSVLDMEVPEEVWRRVDENCQRAEANLEHAALQMREIAHGEGADADRVGLAGQDLGK